MLTGSAGDANERGAERPLAELIVSVDPACPVLDTWNVELVAPPPTTSVMTMGDTPPPHAPVGAGLDEYAGCGPVTIITEPLVVWGERVCPVTPVASTFDSVSGTPGAGTGVPPILKKIFMVPFGTGFNGIDVPPANAKQSTSPSGGGSAHEKLGRDELALAKVMRVAS
jgi:hypothetical protein